MMECEARAHTGAKPQGRLCKPLMQVLDGPRVSCDGKSKKGWAPKKCSAHEVSMALMEWAPVLTPDEMDANQQAKEDIANSTTPENRSKKTISRTSKTTSFVKQVISYGLKLKCS